MRILIAPDKFKGSLTAAEAADAMAEGALAIYSEAEIVRMPVADGGEGTLEAAVAAGFEERIRAVTGPLIKPVGAAWALRGTTAVIETAQASGLAALGADPDAETAGRAHSYGAGQLIAAALDAGATEIILGLGGSAMTDGGCGALRALGLRPLDAAGNVVPLGGAALADVVSVDASALDPRLSSARLRIAVDVRNPLVGTDGAAHVFGPQKGADAEAVAALDAGLRTWARVLAEATGRDVDVPGAGAAGGFPAAFLAFTDARLESGFDLVAELVGLDAQLASADLVITGEGSLDGQSLTGKAPIALADRARDRGIPVIAVAGRIEATPEQLAEHGIEAAGVLVDLAPTPADAIANGADYVRRAVAELLAGA
ncbi:glycerate kinase [Sinomonas sp. ASV486]|uniref:glycerate kinase n=1 Tax=Sinomonas sp. ASV486 TaxID=3051170 RepID=UPI0027DD963E|nr:glycerate kinase [Sinomonas sp. ASV486]MDQ4491348.1 glycerate kinase [Sinomonas sp. ASV486]